MNDDRSHDEGYGALAVLTVVAAVVAGLGLAAVILFLDGKL